MGKILSKRKPWTNDLCEDAWGIVSSYLTMENKWKLILLSRNANHNQDITLYEKRQDVLDYYYNAYHKLVSLCKQFHNNSSLINEILANLRFEEYFLTILTFVISKPYNFIFNNVIFSEERMLSGKELFINVYVMSAEAIDSSEFKCPSLTMEEVHFDSSEGIKNYCILATWVETIQKNTVLYHFGNHTNCRS